MKFRSKKPSKFPIRKSLRSWCQEIPDPGVPLRYDIVPEPLARDTTDASKGCHDNRDTLGELGDVALAVLRPPFEGLDPFGDGGIKFGPSLACEIRWHTVAFGLVDHGLTTCRDFLVALFGRRDSAMIVRAIRSTAV